MGIEVAVILKRRPGFSHSAIEAITIAIKHGQSKMIRVAVMNRLAFLCTANMLESTKSYDG